MSEIEDNINFTSYFLIATSWFSLIPLVAWLFYADLWTPNFYSIVIQQYKDYLLCSRKYLDTGYYYRTLVLVDDFITAEKIFINAYEAATSNLWGFLLRPIIVYANAAFALVMVG